RDLPSVPTRRSSDLTNDREKLLAAADKLRPGHALYTFGWESILPLNTQAELDPTHNPHPGPDPDANLRDASFATLQLVAEALMRSEEHTSELQSRSD